MYHIMKMCRYASSNIGASVSPRSLDPFYKERYCINWVKTSWTYSIFYSD